jgi:hypothetical protein
MAHSDVPALRRNTISQFDNSQWHLYHTPESTIMLTGLGRRLFAQRGISTLLHHYIADATADRQGPADIRQFMAPGGNADVFSVRSRMPLAIKEAKPHTDEPNLLGAMIRLDRLKGVVEESCPRWIDIPAHYGVLINKSDNRQFMLMERIDHGITAGDVIQYGKIPRSDHLGTVTQTTFGPVTPELQHQVSDKFRDLGGWLRKGLVANHLSPDEYLPDLDHNQDNVLLEKLDAPIAGSPFRYWVIDQ